MTDPLDTNSLRALATVLEGHHSWNDEAESADTLRAAADEVDRLRDALVEAHAASERYSQALSEQRQQSMLNEGRLRVVIENAPHAVKCHQNRVMPIAAELIDGTWSGAVCTCWKADAL